MHRLTRLMLRATLVVTLLAAWSTGLVHPLVHADGNGNLVHAGTASYGGDGKPPATATDGLCDVLASLAACLPGFAGPSIAAAADVVSTVTVYGTIRVAEAPPFLSQGPPALL